MLHIATAGNHFPWTSVREKTSNPYSLQSCPLCYIMFIQLKTIPAQELLISTKIKNNKETGELQDRNKTELTR